jgi:hypothetical protein
VSGGLALYTFESRIVLSLINNNCVCTLYYKYIFFPSKQQLEVHQKEENLTENHTTPMVSEFHTKQSINEETQLKS